MNVGRAMRRSAVAAGVAVALWVGASAARAGEEKPPMPVIEPVRQVQITCSPWRGVLVTPDGNAIDMHDVIYVNVWELAAYFWPETMTTVGVIAALVAFARVMRIRRLGRVPGEPYCRKCNYQLTGLLSERCPECGTVITGKMRVIAKTAKWRVAAWLVELAVGVSVWPVLWAAHPNRQPQIAQRWEWQSIRVANWIKGHPSWPWYGMIKKGQQLVEIDLATGKATRAFWPVELRFDCCVLSTDGKSLLASAFRKIDRWDLASGRLVASYVIPRPKDLDGLDQLLSESTYGLAMDGEYIYASAPRKILRWDARTGTPCTAIPLNLRSGSLRASATGGCVVLIEFDFGFHWVASSVTSIDSGTGRVIAHGDFPNPAAFLPGGGHPFTYTVEDGVEGALVVRIRDERLAVVHELPLDDPRPTGTINDWILHMSPDGRLAAVVHTSGEVRIYDMMTQRPVARLSVPPAVFGLRVRQLDFFLDGRLLWVMKGSALNQLAITASLYDLSGLLDAQARRGGIGR